MEVLKSYSRIILDNLRRNTNISVEKLLPIRDLNTRSPLYEAGMSTIALGGSANVVHNQNETIIELFVTERERERASCVLCREVAVTDSTKYSVAVSFS
jgi:hypothetical protein